MNIGKITVSQLTKNLSIPYERILNIAILHKENEHGRMRLYLEISESVSMNTIIVAKGTNVKVTLPDGRILFQG